MIYRFLTIVFFLVLSGCSGGISGTGDGGPIVTDTNDIESTGDAASTPDSQMPRVALFPEQLLLSVPESMLSASTVVTADSNSVMSPGVRLTQGLTASVAETTAIRIDLQLISGHLLTTPFSSAGEVLCTTDTGNDCEFAEAQLSILADANAEIMAASLLAANPTTTESLSAVGTLQAIRAGDAINYNNVSLQSGLAGYFDNRLQYNRADGTNITVQWSADGLLVSILAQHSTATLQSLLQADNGEMTLRRTDHQRGDSSIQMRAIQNVAGLAADATYIEADLSDDEPFFSRAIGSAAVAAIFSESLLDDATRYREANDATGQLIQLETCINPCAQWQSLFSTQTLPDNFFEANAELIDNLSESIGNPIDTAFLPAQVGAFVVTTGDSADLFASDSATLADRLVCGGQRASIGVRAFCWQPTPLGTRAFVFEESRSNGSTTYTLLLDSDSL